MTEIKYNWNRIIDEFRKRKEQSKIDKVIAIKQDLAKKQTN
jgi:hypothetical protein